MKSADEDDEKKTKLQWGPQSFDCGKPRSTCRGGPLHLGDPLASMGPQSFDCGKVPQQQQLDAHNGSFNGAAVF